MERQLCGACTSAAKFLCCAPADDEQHARMNIIPYWGGSSMSSVMGTVAFSTDSTEVARRPLEAEQCALIVVDIQQKLLPPIFNKEMLVRNSQLLVRLAKILSIPIMMTTQYSKGLGATVPEISSRDDRQGARNDRRMKKVDGDGQPILPPL